MFFSCLRVGLSRFLQILRFFFCLFFSFPTSLKHALKFSLGVNLFVWISVFMVPCNGLESPSRLKSCLMLSVCRIGSGSTVTPGRIKQLLKLKAWIFILLSRRVTVHLELTVCQSVLYCTACLQMVGPQMCEWELKFGANIRYSGQQHLYVVIRELMFEQRRLRGGG